MHICRCDNPTIVTPPGGGGNPQTPCSKINCISLPHLLVKQVDSVYPCGQALIVDLSDKIGFDINQDRGIAIISVDSHTDNLTNVQIVSNVGNTIIELQVTSDYANAVDFKNEKFAKLTYRVRQGKLVNTATITIIFRSYCDSINIPATQVCNPCNGNLTDKIVNISIDQQNTNPNVNISITA